MLEPALKQPLTAFRTDVWQVDVSPDDFATLTLGRQRLTHSFLAQVGSACEFLHSKGVMHRDIKPDNVGIAGLDEPFKFYLLDLGHAIAAQTSDDHFRGTMRYLAPEVLKLKRRPKGELPHYDAKVDVWALGLVGAELITATTIRDDAHALQLAGDLSNSDDRAPVYRALREMLQIKAANRFSMAETVKILISSSAGESLSLARRNT